MEQGKTTSRALFARVEGDGTGDVTVLLHDGNGVRLGTLCLDLVPSGVRVEGWSGDDAQREGQLIVHREVGGGRQAFDRFLQDGGRP